MSIVLTPELVRGLWTHMAQTFGSVLVDKLRAPEMKMIAEFLGKMGVLDTTEFLENFATTLGNRIYIPFEIGVPRADNRYGLRSQVILCCHENYHVVQAKREGLPIFAAKYLANSANRAAYEAEAFVCNLEMRYFLDGGVLKNPQQLCHDTAELLRFYACKPVDIAVTEKSLTIAAQIVQSGGVLRQTSRAAIDWLENNAH